MSDFLFDCSGNLVIFLDEGGFSDSHFSTVLTAKAPLFESDKGFVSCCLQIRDFRRFLEVVFGHLSLAGRAWRGIIVKVGQDFFVSTGIKKIVYFDILVFNSKKFCDKIELFHMSLSNE